MTIQANQGFGVSIFGATSAGGGSTLPGGSSGQLQYNASGSFGGMAGTSWDDTNRALTLTGATVTTSNPVLNLSQTWNAAGVTFKGLVFNATDTASASVSVLLDLQVGSVSKLSVRKDGFIFGNGFSGNQVGVAYVSPATFSLGSSHDVILYRAAAATLQHGGSDAAAPVAQTLQVQSVVAGTSNTAGTNFTINGSRGTGTGAGGSIIFQVAPAGSSGTSQNAYATALTIQGDKTTRVFALNVDNSISMIGGGGVYESAAFKCLSTGAVFWNNDTYLYRDAANTLALRNGTNAQAFRVYNTYTDASNNGYCQIAFAGGNCYIGNNSNGTGSAGALIFQANNLTAWQISSNGHFFAYTDNTYDIGASGANRPRNVYVAGVTTSTGGVTIGAGALFTGDYIYNRGGATSIRMPTTGVIQLTQGNGDTGFDRLQFGGSTSSYPALKRSSASLICRLADDSANAAFEALSLKTGAPAGGTSGTWKVGVYNATAPAATGYVEVDIGGTLYKLLAAT